MMHIKYEPEEIELVFRKWAQLGFVTGSEPIGAYVDPERLIAETTRIGRVEGRLLKTMLTWIRDFHDLINVQRLHLFLADADAPVLAAAIQIAVAHGANHRLAAILKHCKPYKEPQPLFVQIDEDGFYDEYQRAHAQKEYLAWGLYGALTEFYEDALQTRHVILSNNPHLAIRALVGPAVRAEILFGLTVAARIHIRALSKKLGYAYSTVHREVISLAANGFLTIEDFGKARALTLSPRFVKYISSIPV